MIVTVLEFSGSFTILETMLSTYVQVAADAISRGIEIQPAWAHGAFVFVSMDWTFWHELHKCSPKLYTLRRTNVALQIRWKDRRRS